MMCWCRFDQSTNCQIALKRKNWQKLHPTWKSDKLGAVQTPPQLLSSDHLSSTSQNLNTSYLFWNFKYKLLRGRVTQCLWCVWLVASLIYQPNTFHPKAKHPNLSIWEKHQKIIKVWQVFKTNFGNKEWDQSDLDTAKDEGDLERSCKFDCQWFCPDWFWQFKINSQPKRGTNTGHFS